MPDGGAAYCMPAEWEPHEATWLAWPHDRDTWPGVFERIPAVWGAMARALRESEEVRILSRDEAMDDEIRRELGGDLGGVRLVRLPVSDAWIRDYGPIFVRAGGSERSSGSGSLAITAWGFNAWGGKYEWMQGDAAVPRKLGEILDVPVVETGMVLEGGSIDVDGEGTLLTTESCLLHSNRNPLLDQGEIERRLAAFLGARKVLWLGSGIAGDDTDGHVDDLARFVAPGRVLAAVESDERDENCGPLAANRERLQGLRDAAGRRLEVVDLPMPLPVMHRGQRLPASYANFYIASAALLVPTFASSRDDQALGILRELFPGRRVVGIDCRAVVAGFGTIHCVTQQEPAPGSAAAIEKSLFT
jgi:agmatine deiminase